jgi:hypothetical protein
LFTTAQSDYSHQFGCPAPAKSVIWKSVKQFRQTGNVKTLKLLLAIVSIQSAYYSAIVTTGL